MSRIKGLELIFKIFHDQVTTKADCLVLAVHSLCLNKLGDFVGLGDNWPEKESPTELLPQGWNAQSHVYTLQYVALDPPKKCILKVLISEADAILTVLDILTRESECQTLEVDKYITDELHHFPSTFQNLEELSKLFDDMLTRLVGGKVSRSSEKPVKIEERSSRPVKNPTSGDPGYMWPGTRIGESDLNPFSLQDGRNSGMLYDPPRFTPRAEDQGFPRGSIPPGARFEPVGPFSGYPNPLPVRPPNPGAMYDPHGFPNRFPGPSPDHLPPPGYDDMFM